MERLYLETKIAADDEGAISGVAWRFDKPDRIGDIIEKSAFNAPSLPIPMLFGHDLNDPVGAWESAEVKNGGLHITGRLLVKDVARAREVHALVKSGAVRGISVGFVKKDWANRADGGRTIKAIDWLEASLVTVPMHPDARVTSAKSALQALRLVAAINSASAHLSNRK